jgi:transposase
VRVIRRIHVLVHLAAGQTVTEVATLVGLGEQTVRDYLAAFLLHGPASLAYGRSPGRPGKLTQTQRQQLAAVITAGPLAAGYPTGCWSAVLIGDWLSRHFGVVYHPHYLCQVLDNLGFSFQKARFVSDHRNEAARAAWMEETWPHILRLARQTGALVLFGDEVSFAQWGSLSYTWAPKGQQPTVKTSGKRKGYKVFGLIDYCTGRLFWKGLTGRFNAETDQQFLEAVVAQTQQPTILIQAGARYHTSQPMQPFFATQAQRLTVVQLPREFRVAEIYGKVWRMDEELACAERSVLLRIIAEQREQIAALQAQVRTLTGQVETLTARVVELEHRDPPAWAKANRAKPSEPRRRRKKREQAFVRRREEPTAVVEHAAETCPDCGTALTGGWVRWRRQVIDVPFVPATVTEHVVLARQCPHCQRLVTPAVDLADQVLGQHRVSLGLMALCALLREQLRLPVRLIQRYLETVHGLHLSQGELVAILKTVAKQAATAVDAIRDGIRASPMVHADETGWRENGQNGYLWSFSTPNLRYFIHGNRSKAMVDAVLGTADEADAFTGTLVTDFYAAYDHYPGPHQRCWVHLLRDIHELRRQYPADTVLAHWATRVGKLYRLAKADPGPLPAWSAGRQAAWRQQRQRRYERALARICQPFVGKDVPQRVLCERILKYLPELFTFVGDPRVPADNNAAERSIRPLVVRRKISGGTRTAAGTLCRTALCTLTETWQLQGRPLLAAWLDLLRNPTASVTAQM